ncbi:EpsG family protein [Amorphus sp. MBR-141]
MLPYWIFFLVPAALAIGERPTDWRTRRQGFGWLVFGLFLSSIIGLRFQVGGDWNSYLAHLERASYQSLWEALGSSDPGYVLLNWIAAQLGLGISSVNFVCGVLFAVGLIAFARRQPRPWLAITVAMPYLVIIVAMGYTRQAVAISFVMGGLVSLSSGRLRSFVIWMLFAAMFHRTAIVLVPIGVLASSSRGRIWSAFWLGLVGVGLFFTFLSDDVDTLVQGYIDAEYQSQGAFIRLAMNILPAIIFLLLRKSFVENLAELRLWTYLALAGVLLFASYFVVPSSTAIDRIGLYVIPIQMFVLSRLPDIMNAHVKSRVSVALIVVYCGLVQLVWLVFAKTAFAWLPYRMSL